MISAGIDAALKPWQDDRVAANALANRGVLAIIDAPNEAIALFDAAFALDEDVMHVYWRAVAEAEKGDRNEALADINACIQHKPRFAEAYHLRAKLYQARGLNAAAMRDYNQALRIAPHTWEFRMNRGLCHFAEEAWQEAIADLQIAKQWSFFEEEAWVALIKSLVQVGAAQRAHKTLALALEREPESEVLIALQSEMSAPP